MRQFRVPVFVFAIAILTATAAAAPPVTSDLLAALARSAAICARSVPGLTVRETPLQNARRGDM